MYQSQVDSKKQSEILESILHFCMIQVPAKNFSQFI